MTASTQRKNDRESAHMHPTVYKAQDGSESQIFLLSSSPFSSEKEKLFFTSRKVDNGIRALHDDCLYRVLSLD